MRHNTHASLFDLPAASFDVTVCLALTTACVEDFEALCASSDLDDDAIWLRAAQYVLSADGAPPPEVAFDPMARAFAQLGAVIRRAGSELHSAWRSTVSVALHMCARSRHAVAKPTMGHDGVRVRRSRA